MMKPYFPKQDGQPNPLWVIVKRKVRFEEVDPLGIVWHGRYSSYFEDARVELGQKFGIGYIEFYGYGIVAPIKKLHVDYHRPLKFQEKMTIEALLHWSDAARMNFEFIIRNRQKELTTTGYTIQMMMDLQENILVTPPAFYVDICKKWKAGELN